MLTEEIKNQLSAINTNVYCTSHQLQIFATMLRSLTIEQQSILTNFDSEDEQKAHEQCIGYMDDALEGLNEITESLKVVQFCLTSLVGDSSM